MRKIIVGKNDMSGIIILPSIRTVFNKYYNNVTLLQIFVTCGKGEYKLSSYLYDN